MKKITFLLVALTCSFSVIADQEYSNKGDGYEEATEALVMDAEQSDPEMTSEETADTNISDEELFNTELDIADADTVEYIYDYCSSLLDDNGNAPSNNFILSCINDDLKNASYQTINSFSQVKALLNTAK